MNPQEDVAALIESLGLTLNGTALVLGTNLFRSEPLASGSGSTVPAAAVFVYVSDSEPPDTFLGAASSMHTAEVEVLVRSPPDNGPAGRVCAESIRAALHLCNTRGNLTGYTTVRAEDSFPEYLEQDQQQCHEWAVSFTLEWRA